ncbi:hypothetical protein IEQ34_014844 [Dendrobium chrysotoxum]|uniref:Uncharacterized protein n=1 Tax=Dendrobium chrysotoxum TaxID=161865 RepID=A0AAV7GLS8_DENCH|nr:hypothetical protein IEQ34_014844 [Dendrobium chrysotoxum]
MSNNSSSSINPLIPTSALISDPTCAAAAAAAALMSSAEAEAGVGHDAAAFGKLSTASVPRRARAATSYATAAISAVG